MAAEPFDVTFELPAEAFADMLLVATYATRLSAVAELPAEILKTTNPEIIAAGVAERIGIPMAESRRVVRVLTNLYDNMRSLKWTPEELVDRLTAHIDQQDNWKPEQKAQWKAAREHLIKVLSGNAFLVFCKARDLAIGHEKVVKDLRVFTSTRPVFTDDVKEIAHFVIWHDLVIEYFDGHRRQTLEFALDATDLANLLSQCSRAELKGITLKRALEQSKQSATIWREPPDKEKSE